MEAPSKYVAATQDALRRLDAGDAKTAIDIGRKVSRALPDYPGAQVVLARAFRHLGHSQQALAHFRRAAELAPQDATRWGEFVQELLKDGQKGRARKVAQKAPLKGPEKKQLIELAKKGLTPVGPSLGGAEQADMMALQSLVQSGQMQAAKVQAEELLRSHPDSAFLYNILGIVALATGDDRNAEQSFKTTLDMSPQFSGAAANLGLALTRQRRFEEAIGVLRRAVQFDPSSIEARTNLANAYLDASWHQSAFDEAGEVLSRKAEDTDALMIRASAAMRLRQYDDVESILDLLESAAGISEWSLLLRFRARAEGDRIADAIALAESTMETTPILITPLARLKSELGDVDEARALLRKAIDAGAVEGGAYLHYSLSRRWDPDDPVLTKLTAAAGNPDPNSIVRKDFVHYALAKAQSDLGDHALAFSSYQTANALQGAKYAYDHDRVETERRDLQNRWSAEAIARLQGAGVESVSPIFIVGMPRSGSTLIEHVVSAHADVSSIGEDTFMLPFFPLDMAPERNVLVESAREAAKAIRRVAGPKGIMLDKYLHNFQRVGLLAAAFPKARFIHTRRDPRAIALSIFTNAMKVGGHPYSTRLESIAEHYLSYSAIMKHWTAALGDRIIEVDYGKFVEDPEPRIRDLIDRLGIGWDDACLRPEAVQKRVKTLSVVQVRSGIHARSVGRWKHYETQLEPFSQILRAEGVL